VTGVNHQVGIYLYNVGKIIISPSPKSPWIGGIYQAQMGCLLLFYPHYIVYKPAKWLILRIMVDCLGYLWGYPTISCTKLNLINNMEISWRCKPTISSIFDQDQWIKWWDASWRVHPTIFLSRENYDYLVALGYTIFRQTHMSKIKPRKPAGWGGGLVIFVYLVARCCVKKFLQPAWMLCGMRKMCSLIVWICLNMESAVDGQWLLTSQLGKATGRAV